ncbi:MAG: tetratricopeptide repeat protein [Chitinophagales bacterium]
MNQIITIDKESIVQRRVLYLIIFIVTFLLYANTIGHSYNMDDNLVTKNHRLTSKGIAAIPEIFTSPYYEDDQGYAYEYRPVVLSTFAIEHSLFGENPHVSHFINVLLYAITGILLFLLLMHLFPNLNTVFHLTMVLLFLSHPLHTEAIANIKNRDEILSFLGGLCTIYFSIKLIIKKNWFYVIGIAISFLLALLSKMSVLPFAFITPFAAILFLRPGIKQLLVILLPLLVISVLLVPLSFTSHHIYFGAILFSVPILLFIYFNPDANYWFSKNTKFLIKWWSAKFSWSRYFDDHIPLSIEEKKSTLFFPNKTLSRGLVLTFFVLAIVFCFTSVLHSNYYLAGLSVLSLSILNWFGNKDVRDISLIPLLLILGIESMWFNTSFSFDVFSYVVFINILFSSRPLKSGYNLILISIFILFSFLIDDTDFVFAIIGFIITYFAFVGKIKSWIFYTFIVVEFILLIALLFFNIQIEGDLGELILPATQPLIFLILFTTRKPITLSQVIVLFIPVLLFINLHFFTNVEALNASNQPIENSIDVLDTQVNTEQPEEDESIVYLSPQTFYSTNRPIHYVEMPLSFDDTWNVKLGTSFYVLGEYLKLLFIPHPMGFYYGYAYIEPVGLNNPQSLISLLLHFALLSLAIYLLYKKELLIVGFGIIYYLACISVFSNIIFPVVGMMGDRFTYVASLGFCLILTFILFKAFRIDFYNESKIRLKPGFILLTVFILGAYSLKTVARNSLWVDALTLMEHDIKHLGKSAQANNLLGRFSMQEFAKINNPRLKQKYVDQGIKHFKKACEIYPDFFNARYDLGRVYMVKGNYNEAIKAFKKVLEMDSTFTDAMVNIANIYEENDMPEKAVPYYEQAIKNTNNSLPYYASLSYALFRIGDFEKAIKVNKEAISKHPTAFDPYSNLAKTYLEIGEKAKAIENFEQAYRIKQDPQLAAALSHLYREQGDIKMANYYESLSRSQQQ